MKTKHRSIVFALVILAALVLLSSAQITTDPKQPETEKN